MIHPEISTKHYQEKRYRYCRALLLIAINSSRPPRTKFHTYAMVTTYLKLKRLIYSGCNNLLIVALKHTGV